MTVRFPQTPAHGIHLASQARVEALAAQVGRIETALAEALGVEPGMLITDESAVTDFLHWPWAKHVEANEALLAKVSTALGVTVVRGDLVIDVAERLAAAGS